MGRRRTVSVPVGFDVGEHDIPSAMSTNPASNLSEQLKSSRLSMARRKVY